MTILVVGDEDARRHAIVQVLQRHHEVLEAATVAAARQELGAATFDVLLCHLTHADGSILELVADVAQRTPETAIITVTGVDDPTIAARAVELGVYGYLVEPFTPDEILITVAGALRRRTLEIERTAHEEQVARLQVLGERERITRDLHDVVIQRLFATGVTLQASRLPIADQQARARVEGAISTSSTSRSARSAT